jgi:hypothetical protein
MAAVIGSLVAQAHLLPAERKLLFCSGFFFEFSF